MNTAVIRAIEIMRLIGQNKTPMSLAEISRELNIPKTTVFHLVNSLVSENCLKVRDKKYELGIGVFELGSLYKADYLQVVRESLHTIKNTVNASAFFAVEDNNHLLYMDKAEIESPLKSSIRLGERMPMHCASHGKAILAYYTKERLDNYLQTVPLTPRTENSITDKARLSENLTLTRDNGYAVSDEENDKGLYCIAAPVFNRDGVPIAALSASFVKMNMTIEALETAKTLVVSECNKISRIV